MSSKKNGNLDETAAIARLPRNCLVLWLGEACGIEGKLGEGPTKYLLSSGSEVRYLTGTPLSPAYPVSQLMKPDQLLPQNAHEQIEALAKELLGTYAPWLTGIVPRTALAVLWLATHRHEVVDGCPGASGSCRVAWKTKLGAYSVQQRQSLQSHL